jgi:hypothetical protein
LIALGLLCVLSAILAAVRFADHDMFHEMALARAYFETGRFPFDDLFAFTPTVSPCVHHEWGTGFIFHAVWQMGGLPAIMALRLLLLSLVLGLAAITARQRGASWLLIAIMSPIGFIFLATALSPVRAQLFTLVFLAIQLLMMDADRAGKRWWVLAWLPMHVLWLNLHGGFVVGPAILGLHWLERVVRTRKPQWHLVAAGALSIPAMLINPWGHDYVRYLWEAITMPRPLISEWAPTWTAPLEMVVTSFAALVILYSVLRRGVRQLPNLIVVIAVVVEALLHLRHLSLLGVVWLAYVPGFLAETPLHALVARIWDKRPWLPAAVFTVAGAASVLVTPAPPWRMELGTGEQKGAPMPLPVHAAEYLEQIGFEGSVLTPFNGTAYLSWRMWPRVKVSLDSRYEVAYPDHVVDDIRSFYGAKESWRGTLERYQPDAVLVPATSKVPPLLQGAGWRQVHTDAGFSLFFPPHESTPAPMP